MPKQCTVEIYEHLFKEGVMVAEKNPALPKHPELQQIPNLYVLQTLRSLKSRGYVTENFAWRHNYWMLTNEGIQFLRDYLHLPAEIVPATLKKPQPKQTDIRGAGGRPQSSRPEGPRGDRDGGYRRAPDKVGEAGPGSAPVQFRGGFGRGKP